VDDPAPLGLGDPAGTPRARPGAQPGDPGGVEAGAPRPHRLGLAVQLGRDIRDAATVPAQRDHPGAQEAVARPQPAARKTANAPPLAVILRRAGADELRHGDLLPPSR